MFIPASALSDYKGRALDMVLQYCLSGCNASLLDTILFKDIGTVYGIDSELLHWTNGGFYGLWFMFFNKDAEKTFNTV